ncbi:MAG: ADOP family duplicated permease [Vicinamibacterales bacterium]
MQEDFRLAVRALRKHPGFVALATLVLALGFGLNTAIFSIVRVLLYKPLPVAASHELVSIYQIFAKQPGRPTIIHTLQFDFLKRHNETFIDITAHWGTSHSLRANGETDIVNAEWVLSNYFDVLGVKPVLGRTPLAAEDEVTNPARVAVISHALWVRRFRSDPAILGKRIDLSLGGSTYVPFTVVGVMGSGFQGVPDPWKPTQIWMTMAQAREQPEMLWSGIAIGRLRQGVSLEQARAGLALQGRQWYYLQPDARPEYEPRLVVYRTNDVRIPFDPSAELIPRRLAAAMTLVVAVVLLVAATNIAGILMARGIGRSGEIAVRRVLGAGPLRLARELLAESVLLAVLGASCGLLLGMWFLSAFRSLTPARFAMDVQFDGAVLLFTAAICLFAGIVVGIAPAHQAATRDVMPWLSGSGAVQTKRIKRRFRHVITLPQIGCSLALLLVAAVYVRALLVAEFANRGYEPGNLLVATPVLRTQPGERPRRAMRGTAAAALEERYAERARRFYDRLLEQLRAIPGTERVAIASWLPLNEPPERPNWSVLSEDAVAAGERHGPEVERASVSPDYFSTMRMTVLSGRDFDARDTRRSPKVVIVSAVAAQRLWPGRNPVGQTLTVINNWSPNDKREWFEVVGVVNDVRPILHDARTRAFVYFPLSQEWRPTTSSVLVRSLGDSRTVTPAVQDAVARADTFADVIRIRTMGEMAGEILYPRRVAGAILAVSSAIALLLAVVGVYGMVSYSVAQRSGEIGVRMTLGADRRDIIRLVLREAGLVAILGCVVGAVFGWTAIRITSNKYLPLPEVDLLSMLMTPVILTAVVLLACYLPARRAASLDPMNVLRRV